MKEREDREGERQDNSSNNQENIEQKYEYNKKDRDKKLYIQI